MHPTEKEIGFVHPMPYPYIIEDLCVIGEASLDGMCYKASSYLNKKNGVTIKIDGREIVYMSNETFEKYGEKGAIMGKNANHGYTFADLLALADGNEFLAILAFHIAHGFNPEYYIDAIRDMFTDNEVPKVIDSCIFDSGLQLAFRIDKNTAAVIGIRDNVLSIRVDKMCNDLSFIQTSLPLVGISKDVHHFNKWLDYDGKYLTNVECFEVLSIMISMGLSYTYIKHMVKFGSEYDFSDKELADLLIKG
jgi:hypothetical protein